MLNHRNLKWTLTFRIYHKCTLDSQCIYVSIYVKNFGQLTQNTRRQFKTTFNDIFTEFKLQPRSMLFSSKYFDLQKIFLITIISSSYCNFIFRIQFKVYKAWIAQTHLSIAIFTTAAMALINVSQKWITILNLLLLYIILVASLSIPLDMSEQDAMFTGDNEDRNLATRNFKLIVKSFWHFSHSCLLRIQ